MNTKRILDIKRGVNEIAYYLSSFYYLICKKISKIEKDKETSFTCYLPQEDDPFFFIQIISKS